MPLNILIFIVLGEEGTIEAEIEAAMDRYTLRIINPGLSNVLYFGPTDLSPYTAFVV